MSRGRIRKSSGFLSLKGLILVIGMVLAASLLGVSTAGFLPLQWATLAQGQPDQTPEPVVEISADESYVNSVIEKELVQEGRFSDVGLDLRAPNEALVTFSAQVAASIRVRPTVTLTFDVVDNQVQIEVTDIRMHSLAIPRRLIEPLTGALTSQMEGDINRLVRSTQEATGLLLTGVQAAETELLIEFSER